MNDINRILENIKAKHKEETKSNRKRNFKLPTDIEFSVDNKEISMKLSEKGVTSNMQNNESAFEGWSLIFKRWLSDGVKVRISWTKPIITDSKSTKAQHYQRFLFRVKKFNEIYDWIEIDHDSKSYLQETQIEDGEYIVNAPDKSRATQERFKKNENIEKLSEDKLERRILNHDLFKEEQNLEVIDRQLPVGIFNKFKRKDTRIFTGGHSAIDIWGIDKKNYIVIYELKKYGNRPVGIISELFFYSLIMHEIQKGKFKIEKPKDKGWPVNEIRNRKIKGVKANILTLDNHPLIDNKLIRIMNKSELKIKYGMIKITKGPKYETIKCS